MRTKITCHLCRTDLLQHIYGRHCQSTKQQWKTNYEWNHPRSSVKVMTEKRYLYIIFLFLQWVCKSGPSCLKGGQCYPLDKSLSCGQRNCLLLHLLDSDSSGEQPYPTFEQPGPEIYGNGLGVVRCDKVYPLLPLLIVIFPFVIT